MAARKSGPWVFADATERDTFGVAEGVLPYDTCILESDVSEHYWTGAAWAAIPGGGGGTPTEWQSVWVLDCAAESVKDVSGLGPHTLDDGKKIYTQNIANLNAADFNGSALRMTHVNSVATLRTVGNLTTPGVYFIPRELDPAWNAASRYAMAVDWEVDEDVIGGRPFGGMIGIDQIYDRTGTGFSHTYYYRGTTSVGVVDRIGTQGTVESNSVPEFNFSTDARNANGLLTGFRHDGLVTYAYGPGYSGGAWGNPWNEYAVLSTAHNDNRRRAPSKYGDPIEARFYVNMIRWNTGGDPLGVTVNRVELFRLGGGIS